MTTRIVKVAAHSVSLSFTAIGKQKTPQTKPDPTKPDQPVAMKSKLPQQLTPELYQPDNFV
ncbi:MAG: hypothetical protein ACRD4F_13405 [Candidatus Angelobacter sp.]